VTAHLTGPGFPRVRPVPVTVEGGSDIAFKPGEKHHLPIGQSICFALSRALLSRELSGRSPEPPEPRQVVAGATNLGLLHIAP